MPLRMRVHDREPIGAALRRFKKLLERSGLLKQLRKRKYFEKPCELRRRAKLRKLERHPQGRVAGADRGEAEDLPMKTSDPVARTRPAGGPAIGCRRTRIDRESRWLFFGGGPPARRRSPTRQ